MEINASFILMHNHESVSKNVKDIPLSLKEKESGYKGLHLELLRVLLFQHIFQEQIFLQLWSRHEQREKSGVPEDFFHLL